MAKPKTTIIKDPDGDEDTDHVMTGDRAWIKVAGFSLCVRRLAAGVRVDIYALGKEDDTALNSAAAHDDDGGKL